MTFLITFAALIQSKMLQNLTKSKQELKLFDTLSTPQPSASPTSENKSSDQQQGTNKWGLFFAATHTLSLPIERLLLKTINAELGAPGCIVDPYAVAFRNLLLPSWSYRLAVGFLASNYKKIVESTVVGVPGMLTYLDARTRWIDGHIKSAVQDTFQQVVILGGGFDTRALRLGTTFPSLTFFEVDSAEILNRKKALIQDLPEDLAANQQRAQIKYVTIDWTNPSALIPALTAAGFQPTLKTVVVMEGLLPHLDQIQAHTILADAAALCPPGSKLLFDFLHIDAFDGSNRLYTGYSTLASALANKGAPFKSGHAIGFSDWVRTTQRIHLRIGEVISPQNIALHLVRPEYESAAATLADSGGGEDGVLVENAGEEKRGWCQIGGCLTPLRAGNNNKTSAGGSSAIPMSIALPQFYSFVSAIKIVPRINLKDAAPPLHLASSNNNTVANVVRRTLSSFGSSPPSTSWFYNGLISMIWGHDTDDEGEQNPSQSARASAALSSQGTAGTSLPGAAASGQHLPVSFASPSANLETQKSSDWSIIASRGGEEEHASSRAVLNVHQYQQPAVGMNSLDHAISIPALQKYDENGDLIITDSTGEDYGRDGTGTGGSGWWTSWLG